MAAVDCFREMSQLNDRCLWRIQKHNTQTSKLNLQLTNISGDMIGYRSFAKILDVSMLLESSDYELHHLMHMHKT